MCLQAARSVLQTILGVWIFNDLLTVYATCSLMDLNILNSYTLATVPHPFLSSLAERCM